MSTGELSDVQIWAFFSLLAGLLILWVWVGVLRIQLYLVERKIIQRLDKLDLGTKK